MTNQPAVLAVQAQDGGASFAVRVTPRAGRDRIDPPKEGVLPVRLAAPPVEGEANAALLRLVAKALGVPPSRVRLLSGSRGRNKRLWVEGLDPDQVRDRLAG